MSYTDDVDVIDNSREDINLLSSVRVSNHRKSEVQFEPE